MSTSVSEQCRACVTILRSIILSVSDRDQHSRQILLEQANDHLERFSLWVGNIGALHREGSPLSLESRLRDEDSVLAHVHELLDDLAEVAGELLEFISGSADCGVTFQSADSDIGVPRDEEAELLEEIEDCMYRLFRMYSLIRQAAQTDIFAKALSRGRYRFNDHFDVAHVGEKFPKLAREENIWLRKRLGEAITKRRHYLSYIQDHRGKLEGGLNVVEEPPKPVVPQKLAVTQLIPDSASRPSTFFTKASSLQPGRITMEALQPKDELESEDDSRSYTTICCFVRDDVDTAIMDRIPKLEELPRGAKMEVECPFCYQIKKFKNEKTWRRHVFSDLRSYVCTSPECNDLYFTELNNWFRHEMENHRVSYTCRLCQNKTFEHKGRYLAHVKKHHAELLEHGEEQLVLGIAQQPMDQIPAQDCPCCFDWVDRVKARANLTSDASDATIRVTPAIFKRHLASHMEQLALFAIPIGSVVAADADSNVAAEANFENLLGELNSSSLLFESPPGSLPEEQVDSHDDYILPHGTDAEVPRYHHPQDVSQETGQVPLEDIGYPEAQTGDGDNISENSSEENFEEFLEAIKISMRTKPTSDEDNWLNKALQIASKKGNVRFVRKMLQKGADIESQDTRVAVASALETASKAGQIRVVHELLNSGVRYEVRGAQLGGALQAASRKGNFTIVFLLLRYWADDDTQRLYRDSSPHPTAHGALQEALQVLLRYPDHAMWLTSMSNLATIYKGEGLSEDAKTLMLQVIEKSNTDVGADHPDTMSYMGRLASIYADQGRLETAQMLGTHVMENLRTKLGPEHPDTLMSMSTLTLIYRIHGRLSEAETLGRQELEIHRRIHGTDKHDTIKSFGRLACILKDQGSFEEAEAMGQQALRGWEKIRGKEHPFTISAIHFLESIPLDQEKNEEADLIQSGHLRDATPSEEGNTYKGGS